MIARILGEGQWEVPDERLEELNRLDAQVEAAVEADDQVTFANVLAALLNEIRTSGTALPAETLQDSDLILPPADATIEEVRELLGDEGLIPG